MLDRAMEKREVVRDVVGQHQAHDGAVKTKQWGALRIAALGPWTGAWSTNGPWYTGPRWSEVDNL